jgi:hypothetical protein
MNARGKKSDRKEREKKLDLAAVLVVDGVFRSILALQIRRGRAGSGCCSAALSGSCWAS